MGSNSWCLQYLGPQQLATHAGDAGSSSEGTAGAGATPTGVTSHLAKMMVVSMHAPTHPICHRTIGSPLLGLNIFKAGGKGTWGLKGEEMIGC
jgi:hypothetical protein